MGIPADTAYKFYLSPEATGLIACPSCGGGKVFDLKDKILPNRKVRLRCKCGRRYGVYWENRQYQRRRVKLNGHYTNLTARRSGRMIVEDISQGGIGFQFTGSEYFREHDLVKTTLELNNRDGARITLNSKVKHIHEHFVGCKALDFPEAPFWSLVFYLLT